MRLIIVGKDYDENVNYGEMIIIIKMMMINEDNALDEDVKILNSPAKPGASGSTRTFNIPIFSCLFFNLQSYNRLELDRFIFRIEG